MGLEVDATNAYLAFTSSANDGRGDMFFDVEPNSVVQQVLIDVQPGSDPNSVNCTKPRGVIPVAIASTSAFDATTVDPATVRFDGAAEIHRDKAGAPRSHFADYDNDGDPDIVFHFRLGDTGLTCASTSATLSGATMSGTPIGGSDTVRMVGGP